MDKEPALIVGAVQSVIVLLVAFGIPISADQKVAILGATAAILALVGAVVTRYNVWSRDSVKGGGRHELP